MVIAGALVGSAFSHSNPDPDPNPNPVRVSADQVALDVELSHVELVFGRAPG